MIKHQSQRIFNLALNFSIILSPLLPSSSSLRFAVLILHSFSPPPPTLTQFHSWETMKQFSVWFHCCTSEWLMASCWSCVSHSFYFSLSAVCDECVCVCVCCVSGCMCPAWKKVQWLGCVKSFLVWYPLISLQWFANPKKKRLTLSLLTHTNANIHCKNKTSFNWER